MGLSIEVGILADLKVNDEEGFEHYRQQFEAVNQALNAKGLPAHKEPAEPRPDLPFSCSLYGYSGLHFLRRIAAHLDFGEGLPPPGDEAASEDPLMDRYYDAVFTGETPRHFDHLMCHSDAEGYYLPQDFEEILYPDEALKIPGGMIGSAVRLLAECERLAKALRLPADLDPNSDEVFDAVESQGEGEGWRRYGVESHTCLNLMAACRASIRTGAAVVFT